MIEQDHRHIKKPTGHLLGFKSQASLESTIAGYVLVNALRKRPADNAQGKKVFEPF
jgi:putative transposase